MERGTVTRARPILAGERLRVVAEVRSDTGETREVSLPDREVAAILPRSILLGESRRAPAALLGTLAPIVARMAEGRIVRMWRYADRWYCSFLPWKPVRFVAEGAGPPGGGATAGCPDRGDPPAAASPGGAPPSG